MALRARQVPRTDQVWVDCAAKCTRQVMAEVLNVCEPVRKEGMLPVLHLRHPERLADSLTRLLKSLSRASDRLDLRIEARDQGGYVGAFMKTLCSRPRDHKKRRSESSG